MTASQSNSDRFSALALQLATRCVNSCPDDETARARIADNITRVRQAVGGSKAFVRQYSGENVQLVVLPEYFLTGFPMGDSVPGWQAKAALEIDGPEYEALSAIASDMQLHLAGNAYEVDPNFPKLYFQCCFVIGPNGDVVLRYRRMISLSGPTPYDVWDKYLDIYGLDGVFPVADTPIGKLAAIASEEILYPEIARCHAMRGAEVFVHSTSEAGTPRDSIKEIARRARAIENMAFVVSANSAALLDNAVPADSTTGMTKIVDYHGHVLAEAMPGGETMVANATIDLGAMREARRRTGLINMLSRQPFQAYAESYAETRFREANGLVENGTVTVPERSDFEKRQMADIEKLAKAGLI